MGIADPSKRLEAIPPYKFQELEQQIADKRAAGIDVISLGIADPDGPTYPHIVSAMQEAVADPGNQKYPSNRGRPEFRQAFAEFYEHRFGVEIDAESEVIPAIGAKECIYNLCFAFLDPGGVALASDPGYPVYTGGTILAGATPELLPLVPELGFAPDLSAVSPDAAYVVVEREGERLVRAGEDGARIGERLVEPERVEVVAQVVVRGDVLLRLRDGVAAPQVPGAGQDARRPARPAPVQGERPAVARGGLEQSDQIRARPLAVHVRLADADLAVAQDAREGRVVVEHDLGALDVGQTANGRYFLDDPRRIAAQDLGR